MLPSANRGPMSSSSQGLEESLPRQPISLLPIETEYVQQSNQVDVTNGFHVRNMLRVRPECPLLVADHLHESGEFYEVQSAVSVLVQGAERSNEAHFGFQIDAEPLQRLPCLRSFESPTTIGVETVKGPLHMLHILCSEATSPQLHLLVPSLGKDNELGYEDVDLDDILVGEDAISFWIPALKDATKNVGRPLHKLFGEARGFGMQRLLEVLTCPLSGRRGLRRGQGIPGLFDRCARETSNVLHHPSF